MSQNEKNNGFDLGNFFQQAQDFADDALHKTQDAANQASSAISGATNQAGAALSGAAKATGSALAGAAEQTTHFVAGAADHTAHFVSDTANQVGHTAQEAGEAVSHVFTGDQRLEFPSLDSLRPVVAVVNEAGAAVQDTTRNLINSPLAEYLAPTAGIVGAAGGAAISFRVLSAAGTAGLNAAGITSGLAAAGSLVGGGMVAGIFVLAAPVAVLAVGGAVGTAALVHQAQQRQLRQEKERLLKAAIEKEAAIEKALKEEVSATQDRLDYLHGLNVMLRHAIKQMQADLGEAHEGTAEKATGE